MRELPRLTAEATKNWCSVCLVFIEELENLTLEMHRGALVNMFREMDDHRGDIQAGIRSYSGLLGLRRRECQWKHTPS